MLLSKRIRPRKLCLYRMIRLCWAIILITKSSVFVLMHIISLEKSIHRILDVYLFKHSHEPFARYVILQVAYALGMPGTFSKETTS